MFPMFTMWPAVACLGAGTKGHNTIAKKKLAAGLNEFWEWHQIK